MKTRAFCEIFCNFAQNKHQMGPNMLGPLLLLSVYIQTKRYKIKCKQAGLFAERSRSHETHFCANLIEGSAEFQQEVVLPNFRPQGCFLSLSLALLSSCIAARLFERVYIPGPRLFLLRYLPK
jgi:hypothetical protein